MQKVSGLSHLPLFTPVVCNVHSGLAAETFFPARLLAKSTSPAQIADLLAHHYQGERFVKVMPFDPQATLDDGFFDITACNGRTNRADIFVFHGHDEQIAGLPVHAARQSRQ